MTMPIGFTETVEQSRGDRLPCSTTTAIVDLRDVVTSLLVKEAEYCWRSEKACNEAGFPLYFDSWRPTFISWMYSIIDIFSLNPLCVPTAVYYLDTCSHVLSGPTWRQIQGSKDLYPLMAMTSLNLAIKCHETRMFPLDQLVLLLGRKKGTERASQQASSMQYTPEDIIRMERTLLQECQWKLHPVTTHDFLHQIVQVLREETRLCVLEQSLLHIKNSLMWEHVLHEQQSQHFDDSYPKSFLPSTLAFASVLLSMEDLHLSLDEKQACCMAVLQVANMSTQTPRLSKAYNWLVYAKNLQAQLVVANLKQQAAIMPTTPSKHPAEASRIVSPTAIATLYTKEIVADAEADFDSSDEAPSHRSIRTCSCSNKDGQPVVVSPTCSTTTAKTSNTMADVSLADDDDHNMVLEETSIPHLMPSDDAEIRDNYDSIRGDDKQEEKGDLSEVIFYSHTYTGDGFEVMAIEAENACRYGKLNVDRCDFHDIPISASSDQDMRSPERSSEASTANHTDLSAPNHILTESLDEDGFEVSYRRNNGQDEEPFQQAKSSTGCQCISDNRNNGGTLLDCFLYMHR